MDTACTDAGILNSPLTRILVVEDEEDDFFILQSTLEDITGMDYDVTWSRTPDEAEILYRERSFDLCLTDYRMGARSGIDLIREMQLEKARCPIILISGAASTDVERAAAEAGAANFIEKEGLTPRGLERAILYALAVKDQQREQHARDHAAQVQQVKTTFLAMVSHELRTPLSAISGFSEFMMTEPFGPVGHERYLSYLSDIKQSSERLQDTVNSILDFSNLMSGSEVIYEEPLDPMVEAIYCSHMVREYAAANNVTVKVEVHKTDVRLFADRGALRKILLHLLNNAIKYTDGGEIEITFGLQENGTGGFEIRDDGIGMPLGVIARALQPFRQGEEGLQRSYEGLGLGLPIARGLTTLHGGTIELDSEPEEGTKVRVWFPKHRILPTQMAVAV